MDIVVLVDRRVLRQIQPEGASAHNCGARPQALKHAMLLPFAFLCQGNIF